MFDLKTKVLVGIASSLLIAAIVLISVVFCLYFKVSKALKCAKEYSTSHLAYGTPSKVTQAKVIPAQVITADPCRPLQCCDECTMYTDTLPPCFCNPNEGL
ncbi:protein FAM24A-like [Perognathus longimembris pacificus]|uniref:protein FAM24A-like n=1 Tax=Perognathus longimembris pacificus TaxID=214514 RepID=UPI0020191BFD|nr:protein FAM24A-like [Perognathus longimembris pacificus]